MSKENKQSKEDNSEDLPEMESRTFFKERNKKISDEEEK